MEFFGVLHCVQDDSKYALCGAARTQCHGTAGTRFLGQQRHDSLGSEGASEAGQGFDDLGGPLCEFVVAEGAVVGLEDGAEEEGVDAGEFFRVAPDFDGFEALQFGDGEGLDGGGDGVPLDCVGEDKGEVALDGLVAGEIVGGDFFEGKVVETREVELGEVDGLAELALGCFGGG